MTAKEALRELVDELTEEQAQSLLARLSHLGSGAEFEPLTPEQLASLERGIAQTDSGHGIPHEEVLRRLGRK